jgi:Peptidase family M23
MSSTTIELRRHAPVGRGRRAPVRDEASGLAHLYASSKRRVLPDLYITDRAEARRGGGFRWFFSTCLAAGVGAIAIAAVIFGNMDAIESRGGFLPALERTMRERQAPRRSRETVEQGLNWSAPKSDRLQEASGAAITKYVVQESISQRRGNREYIHHKPYARIVVRLAAVPTTEAAQLPRFDPVRLLAGGPSTETEEAERESAKPSGGEVTTRVVELSGALLPSEDGQELEGQEVADIVRRAVGGGTDEAVIRSSFLPEGAEIAGQIERGLRQAQASKDQAANTSVIEKTTTESDDIDDDADSDSRRIKVKANRGEGLEDFLRRHGADSGLARSMADAAKSARAVATLAPDLDIELGLLPSLTQPDKLEPARITILSGAGEHRLTIARNAAGEFFASTTPVEVDGRGRISRPGASPSLYASLYLSALGQGIAQDTIEQILRVHAPETDFRRRARGSDGLELFFDLKDEDKGADSAPGDLLFTAITVDGDVRRYYRFRTPDGTIDYYDPHGANSRRFLMRRPTRGDEVKFNNGFGMRPHPILGGLRMHTGVDYSGPLNTPIVAAGSGVIEEVRFKVNNGNYIRIRHANGYQTAYSHMSRFAAGAREGAKVTQGQVIGYLGNTGLSTGPHLHFEVLVGNRFVDPLKLPDQREKRLSGKQLADFNRERARIEDLMRRPPVRVARMDGR